jgi:hypothetical protein
MSSGGARQEGRKVRQGTRDYTSKLAPSIVLPFSQLLYWCFPGLQSPSEYPRITIGLQLNHN